MPPRTNPAVAMSRAVWAARPKDGLARQDGVAEQLHGGWPHCQDVPRGTGDEGDHFRRCNRCRRVAPADPSVCCQAPWDGAISHVLGHVVNFAEFSDGDLVAICIMCGAFARGPVVQRRAQ